MFSWQSLPSYVNEIFAEMEILLLQYVFLAVLAKFCEWNPCCMSTFHAFLKIGVSAVKLIKGSLWTQKMSCILNEKGRSHWYQWTFQLRKRYCWHHMILDEWMGPNWQGYIQKNTMMPTLPTNKINILLEKMIGERHENVVVTLDKTKLTKWSLTSAKVGIGC